ncbi:MAG: hypothetical protein CME70_02040 [Halobacteriovorax sp.]|nr:hypothetical protein [Halobacteriovorax sp.]|tara:strand:+ start:20052 stop:21614 length:1563 start_codon:yes stop_codon:yes gene_type:complete
MKKLVLLILILSLNVFANEYKFPFYEYEKLVQINKEQCRLNIKHQHIIVQKHYEADVKLLAMQWMGKMPGLRDGQQVYKNLPGLSLQNRMRHRDMFVLEKIAHEVISYEKKMIEELGGDAAGNNWNRLQAKSSSIVVQKLKTSLTYLEEMERTLLNILGYQSARTSAYTNEEDSSEKGKYSKGFKPGLYEATYASSEYEKKHNKSCMWNPDRKIEKRRPYCGFVWSHGGNFYLERCPGDVHPFGKGHAEGAGVKNVVDIFDFKEVKKCDPTPNCNKRCFDYCLKKNQFNTKNQEELVKGECKALADPLFPAQAPNPFGQKAKKYSNLTDWYLDDFQSFPVYYPKFSKNNKNEKDVTVEIERYYLMTGEYEKEDCRSGKRKFLLEILDSIKQLISLEKNLIEYYETASSCHIKLAEKIEDAAGVGVKHHALDSLGTKASTGPSGLTAIEKGKTEKDKPKALTEEEQKQADASFLGLSIREQNELLKKLEKSGFKFTENHLGLICKRTMKKDFCGGTKNNKK